jgi:flagellar biosynthesis protein
MSDEAAGRSKQQTVALQYQEKETLPEPLGRGAASLAAGVLALARKHGIPTQDPETLGRLLEHLPKESAVSPETYRLIAEIVSFLFKADREYQNAKG